MRIISALAVSGALVAASVTGAKAADLYVKAPPMVVETYNWTGWYGGVGVGYLSGDSAWAYTTGATTRPGFDFAVAGIYAGAQYQFGSLGGLGGLVLGVEASTNWSLEQIGGGTACPNPAFTCQAHLNHYVTAGGRVGLAWGNFMVYGSGGYAGGELDTRGVTVATGVIVEPTTAWSNGWYAGAGFDWMFYKDRRFSWLLGVDYKHVELDAAFHSAPPGTLVAGVSRFADAQFDVVQARLTVKMDGPAWFW